MSTLYAGPWIGEFGWELCWWNPLVRHAAGQFDRVVVASHAESEYLYEFADEFIPLQARSFSFHEGELLSDEPQVPADKSLAPQEVFHSDKTATRLEYKRGREWRWQGMPLSWRNLAPPSPVASADVMCSFRSPKSEVQGKDYPVSMCQKVIDLLLAAGLTAACCGGPGNYHFDETVDMRGRPLEEQCSAMAAAKCAVGPSSGVLHLASLCGCPHVTWYTPKTHPDLKVRYEIQWNPFGTPVVFVDGHPPEPELIAEAVRGFSCG